MAAAITTGAYSLLLARAQWLFRRDTASSVPAAVRLVPYNAAYVARLAAWQPSGKNALLHRALELNPFDAESWIQLGFNSEFQQNNDAGAEKLYLQAADVNKMFLPKWTLTNYYFRHGQIDKFFQWATATLAITPYSPEPIFVQMWLVSQDANRIAAAIPERPRALLPYAWFLSNSHQYSSIASVVQRLIHDVGRSDPHAWGRDDLLAAVEDRLVAEGDRAPALAIWASMVRAGWLRDSIPDVTHPLINGNFRTPFYSHGFDWTPVNNEGVRLEHVASEGQIRLEFSGDEPESCVVLQQFLPMEPGRKYKLLWRIRSGLLERISGLTWRLRPAGKLAEPGIASHDLSLSQTAGWEFRAPAGAQIDELTLEYARPLGHLRARGVVVLEAISSAAE